MVFTEAWDWQLGYAILLIVATVLSKLVQPLRIRESSVPAWYFLITITLVYLLFAGFVNFIGIGIILLLIAASSLIDSKMPTWIRYLSGTVSVLIFLGLGFKAFPGFNNQILVEAQTLKGNSTDFFKSYNFDKTLAGVIFFLLVVPSPRPAALKKICKQLRLLLLRLF